MIEYNAKITCPECGFTHQEVMPDNYLVTLYQCASCGTTLKPKNGVCCVYCSYSDKQCPAKQKAQKDQ